MPCWDRVSLFGLVCSLSLVRLKTALKERDVYAFERPSRCAATMEENFDVNDYIIIYFLHRIDLLLLIIIIIIRHKVSFFIHCQCCCVLRLPFRTFDNISAHEVQIFVVHQGNVPTTSGRR